jgi:Domain of unknown function (DUF4166)
VGRNAHAVAFDREPGAVAPYGEFRALLGEAGWRRLPPAIQRRFARALAPGESAVYLGEVAETELRPIGWLWAQMARFMGAPLPLKTLSHSAAAVVVTADAVGGSQLWTRIYHEPGRLPQVIRSIKSFSGPTGLEERVGAGVAMALRVSVEDRALVFRSSGYHWRCGSVAVHIPRWLTPGDMEVRHREERQGRFSFTLNVVHPWFGRIIRQVAFFRDSC